MLNDLTIQGQEMEPAINTSSGQVKMAEQTTTVSIGKNKPVKVLIVDDSPIMCKALKQILSGDDEIEVASIALNGVEALNKLSSEDFDVCTLDVHMPGMSGLTVLKNIMVRFPVPTLMVSAFTGDGSRVTFEALRYGAVDFFKKPSRTGAADLKEQADILRARLKRAAQVQVKAARYLRIKPTGFKAGMKDEETEVRGLAVIHGSTGGYSSILAIVPHLEPSLEVPVIVSLTTSQGNLRAFADYMRPFSPCPIDVPEGKVELKAGHIYLLAVNQACTFEQAGGKWEMFVTDRPIDTEKEGAVDLILLSASEAFENKCMAVFVSGDNMHGITGAREVVRNRGRVMAQTPENCLAPFMPRHVLEEFDTESGEPVEIARQISGWGK